MSNWREERKEKLDIAQPIFEKIFGGNYDPKIQISRVKQIVSCKTCDGTGFVSREELSCYHKREYSTITNGCAKCDASGRQVEITDRIMFHANYPFENATMNHVTLVPYPQDPITEPWVSVVSTEISYSVDKLFEPAYASLLVK